MDLPPGVTFDRVASQLDIGQAMDFCTQLLKLEALMDGQSPQAVQVDAAGPESGYKLKIQNLPLDEQREDNIEIYTPPTEEVLYRAIVVYNTHAKHEGLPLISEELRPVWSPGKIEVPVDAESEDRSWALRYANNEATPLDRLMAERNISKEEARAIVEENAEINNDLSQIKAAGFGFAPRPDVSEPPEPEPEPDEEDEDE